jgi:hypothetical protein
MSLLSWLKKSNQNVAPEQEQVDSEERLEQEEQASGIMFHIIHVLDYFNEINIGRGGLYISTVY